MCIRDRYIGTYVQPRVINSDDARIGQPHFFNHSDQTIGGDDRVSFGNALQCSLIDNKAAKLAVDVYKRQRLNGNWPRLCT